MKIKELVETMNNPKNKMLNADQLQSVLAKELETKKYLSIKDKKQLVEDIVNECILYDNGVFKFDDIEKYIYFTMKTIDSYTNIELSEDVEEDYDVLCESGLLDLVINTFKKEYDDVSILLQMKCEYILSCNNVESQVGKFLNNILDKIDMFSGVLSNTVENFDISKLPIAKEDIAKVLEFVNSQK